MCDTVFDLSPTKGTSVHFQQTRRGIESTRGSLNLKVIYFLSFVIQLKSVFTLIDKGQRQTFPSWTGQNAVLQHLLLLHCPDILRLLITYVQREQSGELGALVAPAVC